MHPKVVEGLTYYEGVLPASSVKDDTEEGSEFAFIDANGQFAPFHPLVTPVVLTWSNVVVSTKPSMSLFGKTPRRCWMTSEDQSLVGCGGSWVRQVLGRPPSSLPWLCVWTHVQWR